MNVGIHFSNKQWERPSNQDFQRLRLSKPECIKTCLFTQVGFDQTGVHRQLRSEHPNALIIARLFAPMGGGAWPPHDFAKNFRNQIEELKGTITWFEVHNEPNHNRDVEGFGNNPDAFNRFAQWSEQTLQIVKNNHPWAKWVFPGQLVDAGNYVNFWKANLNSINKFDAFGVHCYWQFDNHKSRNWGRCYEIAHELVPDKPIIITEFGDSTNDRSPAQKIPFYQEWYQEANNQPYISGTALYIMGGTSDWINRPGIPNFDITNELATAIGQIPRESIATPQPVAPTPPPPTPTPAPPPSPDLQGVTNQDIITTFHDISLQFELGNWGLMRLAGLSLGELVKARQGNYSGPKIDQMSNLNDQQKESIKARLVKIASLRSSDEAVNFSIASDQPPSAELLLNRTILIGTPLRPTKDLYIDLDETKNSLERRVARAWNRYGILLFVIADALELAPSIVVAIVANQSDKRGIGNDGRLLIRFEPQVFYDKWGKDNADSFNLHFRFNSSRPEQEHRWLASAGDDWRDCHKNHRNEWKAFTLARTLNETAAKLSIRMGMGEIMGFNYELLGYYSADQMFEAFTTNERYQLFALFDFISGKYNDSRRLIALQDEDLDSFAALHYSFGQAAQYSISLRKAVSIFERLNPIKII